MKVKLPVVTRDELVDGQRIFEYEEKEVTVDNSMRAQMRWEANFPELAKNENIIDYSERIRGARVSITSIIAELKVIYCFLDMDLSFDHFLQLFDFSQKKYIEKLIDSLKEAFGSVFSESSEKN
nr:MAG TPA: hypothetical protein [Caudoviricetes sp.]